jgi:hypothetical protein
MKKLILFLFLLGVIFSSQYNKANANNIEFGYDAAGNCTIKYKTVVISSLRAQSINQDDEQFDDLILEDDVFGDVRIIIYPNPTKGFLRIEFQNKPTELSVNYRLTETNGRPVASGATTDYSLLLDLSNFATGVYFLNLAMNGRSEIYKIIKQ